MKLEKYELILSSTNALEYTFISIGPKGKIKKIVQYSKTQDKNIYNLAFGDYSADSGINDLVKNDNKDRDKILATVAATVFEFTANYPDKFVFFTGSTPERTRLYRMAIVKNIDELLLDFYIYGVNKSGQAYTIEHFQKGKNYQGFMIKRK